jgi:hypothetical protein
MQPASRAISCRRSSFSGDNEARRGLMSPRSGIDSVLPESDRRISTMRRATRAADEQEDEAAA